MNRILCPRWSAVVALCGIALASVVLLSRKSSRGGTAGEQMAAFLSDARDARGRRVFTGLQNAIPVLGAEEILRETDRQGSTFRLKVFDVELQVPRNVTRVVISDGSHIFERPFWEISVNGPRHSITRHIDSRRVNLFRISIGDRDLTELAKLVAKRTDLSKTEALQKLEGARRYLLALSDEGILRHVLEADNRAIQKTADWGQAMQLLLSLMARDWVWDVGKPCYTLKTGPETVYIVHSRQSHRGASIFFLVAFGQDGALLWTGDLTSKPRSTWAEVLGFVRQVLGPTDATSQPVATRPWTSTDPLPISIPGAIRESDFPDARNESGAFSGSRR